MQKVSVCMLCFASRGQAGLANLVTKINSNFDYALTRDPSENRPVCSWSHYCIPLKTLKILQKFYITKEALFCFLKKNSLLTLTRNILEAETSSMFFLVSASRYNTSENPLAFALLITSSTFFFTVYYQTQDSLHL